MQQKSFTLIEILVVIVIIGIISVFIIVSMAGVSSKAGIAKSQAFANSIRNSLLMDLISEWKLDEVNFPMIDQVPDSWGLNTGTLKENGYVGACDFSHCPQLQTTNCIYRNCMFFDGINDYIYFGDILDVGTSDFTISIWAKVISLPFSENKYLIGKSDSSGTDGRYSIGIMSDGKVRAIFDPTIGTTVNSVKNVDIGWNFISVVWDRDDTMRIYLNGSYEDEISISSGNGINFNTAIPFLIGSYTPTSYFFGGSIDSVSFFFAVLPSSQIKQNYYSGLNKLLSNQGILSAEYVERIIQLKNNLAGK
ncbi:MAG: LamG domain-containing protein [Candidatus Paceibacterota bacterium]|jgi:prepilin-type N-terminal cleavage/methylation domain-containing protein